eukprot:1325694-Pyramimonas_sp.AAC.1
MRRSQMWLGRHHLGALSAQFARLAACCDHQCHRRRDHAHPMRRRHVPGQLRAPARHLQRDVDREL